jgi:hypothetical protein
MNFPSVIIALIFLSIPLGSSAVGTWVPVANPAPEGIDTMFLLSDGTVMAAGGNENTWYRLTPDNLGSYANGTWSTRAQTHYTRLYYSSAVLTNGRVIVAGGEYGTGTNAAEIYDPLVNTWTTTTPPPAGQVMFYDSNSKILPNGNLLVTPVFPATSGGSAIYVTASNLWVAGPTLFRGSYQDEASWVKLPDDSILTIDPFGTNSERYIPSLNRWINDANVPVSLYDPFGFELGAAFLLPDGRAFYLGATGNTALYTPSGNTNRGSWAAGPVIPNAQGTPDAPAAMMVNGKILCAVSPVPTSPNHFPSPTSFYEYDPVGNSFTQVTGPTATTYNSSTYIMRMLDLPDGSVLLAVSDTQLYIYRPDGSPLAAGQPVISSIVQNVDGSFHATGKMFNGITEGAAYGDDAQMDSNYPLVRMTNSNNGNVYYARTFNWNSTSVMTGNRPVSTEFSLPVNLPSANYSLVVVANGNASAPVAFSTASLPPIILTQPQSQTLSVGATATFNVAAAGTPLNYYWKRDGSFIPGATTSSYTTNNVQLSDSGAQFSCVVSNVNGPVTSSNAVLTVVPGFPPTITAQPLNQTVPAGSSATFSVTATSTVAIAYFWKRNGSFVPGGTSSSFTTNNMQLSDSGSQFSCLVSNAFGTTPSSNATLTVIVGPSNDICTAAFVVSNSSYTMSQSTTIATTTGDPSPTCISGFGKGVWFLYPALTNGTVIADTIGSSFDTGLGVYVGTCGSLSQLACNDDGGGSLTSKTTNTVTAGSSYYYLAGGYSGASGNLTFHLNFTPASSAPTISVQPTTQTAQPGGGATFTIGASGAPPLSYYWRRNGSPIAGATNTSYTTNGVQLADSGTQFSCLVSNASGTVLSSNALLIVSTDLVKNGGFELGNFSFWTTSGNFSSCSVVNTSPYVHSGSFGARLGPVGSLGYLSQTLASVPGQLYLISCSALSGGDSPIEFQVLWDGSVYFDQDDLGTFGWRNIGFLASASTSSTVLQLGFRDDPDFLGLDDISVLPVTNPAFQTTIQTNNTLVLTWSTIPTLIYQVQFKSDLGDPTWLDLGSPITADSDTLTISDPIGPDPQRFYRISIQGAAPNHK